MNTLCKTVAAVAVAMAATARPAAASIEDCLSATCRIRSGNSVGTGCAFEVVSGEVRILTNYHVAEGRQVQVQFFDRGHPSNEFVAASRWWSYQDYSNRDINVVAVPVEAFGAYLPAVIPLADANEPFQVGMPIASAGCEEGRWPSAWVGHVVSVEGPVIKFLPRAIPGRSGSAVFDEAGTKIVGLVAWHDGTYGVAMTIADIHNAMDGKRQVSGYMGPLVAVPPRSKYASPSTVAERHCVHGVPFSQPCQQCPPGGCRPFQQRPRQNPYGQAPYSQQPPAQGGGAYRTRPPDEATPPIAVPPAAPAPDLSQYATHDELGKLRDELIGKIPGVSAIESRINSLESGQQNFVSHSLLNDLLKKERQQVLGNHPTLAAMLDDANKALKQDVDKQLGEGFKDINATVIAKAEGAAAAKVGEQAPAIVAAAGKLIAGGAGATGAAAWLPFALSGGLPTIGLALAGWLVSRKLGGLGGAAPKQPFPG